MTRQFKRRCWDRAREDEAAELGATVIRLADIPRPAGLTGPADIAARYAVAAARVDGGRVVDVGCHDGTFLRHLHARGAVTLGVDVSDLAGSSALGLGWIVGSILDPQIVERAVGWGADVVSCQETLEHLPGGDFDRALAAIRRVAGRRVVTVPWCESEPLYRGHFQRFDGQRIRSVWPTGRYTVLVKRQGTPWILIEEDDS